MEKTWQEVAEAWKDKKVGVIGVVSPVPVDPASQCSALMDVCRIEPY